MNTQNLKIGNSLENLFICKGEKYSYLLNPHSGASALVETSILAHIETGTASSIILNKLQQRGIISTESLNTQSNTIRPVSFMIDFTKACQNRCIYCFRDLDQHRSITRNKLASILQFLINYCKKYRINHISIQPWGGEPLLAWEQIKFMQDVMSENGIKLKLIIETNAIGITHTIAKELFDREVAISVSIDGPEEIHNNNRPMLGGKGSHKDTMRGYKLLQEAGYGSQIGSVCVITKHSMNHINTIIDYFAKELHVNRVKINLIKENDNVIDNIALSDEDIRIFSNNLCDKLIQINEEGFQFGESGIIERLHNLLDMKTTSLCCSRGCQARNRIFSFDMQGNIYPCDLVDNTELRLGNIENVEDLPSLIKSQKENPFYFSQSNAECSQCPYNLFCNGGCTTMKLYKHSDIDTTECIRNKTLYPRLIDMIVNRPQLITSITKGELNII